MVVDLIEKTTSLASLQDATFSGVPGTGLVSLARSLATFWDAFGMTDTNACENGMAFLEGTAILAPHRVQNY
ncbi:hypothetical protein [Verrucomicrobium spinosum]|uniref:hypothetical protein n=1 Tax=Verrucomicrobium spinosum TaxID=2736 RepID=UPI000174613B|nr:hypothetical protein [Verrucomicrobium spinosum]